MSLTINVNGFDINASFSQEEEVSIWIPLLEKWKRMYAQSQKRILIMLAAPPGAGKSTLVAYLEHLSISHPNLIPIQSVGMDGFHYPNSYLSIHFFQKTPLSKIKGSPESFDVYQLRDSIAKIKEESSILWPVYDRTLHDVVYNAIEINKPIILLEGNYLLLNEQPWCDLHTWADDTIFIKVDSALVQKRLINRKIRGGLSEHEAIAFYQNSDRKNVERVLQNSIPANTTFVQDQFYHYHKYPISLTSSKQQSS